MSGSIIAAAHGKIEPLRQSLKGTVLETTRACAMAYEEQTGITGLTNAMVKRGYWKLIDEPKGAQSCKA